MPQPQNPTIEDAINTGSEQIDEKEKKPVEEMDLGEMTEDQQKDIVAAWVKKFKRSEDHRRPFLANWLRFYKLYRALREKTNYAYNTSLMPAIAFEIIETVKPRLAAANINTHIIPREEDDVDSPSLMAWEDLVEYDLDVAQFKSKKIDLISAVLEFGFAVAMVSWKAGKDGEDGDPDLTIWDLWLTYWDPEATDLAVDSKYEIFQIFKTKEAIMRDEKKRKEKLYNEANLKKISNKTVEDPRKERYEVNTKRMGMITAANKVQPDDAGDRGGDKIQDTKLELWQILDHEYDKLIVIGNRQELLRYEETPYLKINNGRNCLNMVDHKVPWELIGIGHIEPVESTIYEIADSRNQAMDDITMYLDPIVKVKKGSGIKKDDIIFGPGEVWMLANTNDVTIERGTDVSRVWIEKDNILKKDIQTSLAISEYAMGMPNSTTEPGNKVELLLLQTNIRFSLLLQQFEIFMTKIVNMFIQMNQEFLTQDKAMRLLGEGFKPQFKKFKEADKQVMVDAIVEIEPKLDQTPQQERVDVMALYKVFVADDRPDGTGDPQEVEMWKKRKRVFQKAILNKFGMKQFADAILGPEQVAQPAQPEPIPEAPPEPAGSPPEEVTPQPEPMPAIPEKIPLIGAEQGNQPAPEPIPVPQNSGGMMSNFLNLFKGRRNQ